MGDIINVGVNSVVEQVAISVSNIDDSIMVSVLNDNEVVDITISEAQGEKGDNGTFEHLIKISAEPIPSYTPVAIANNQAYRYSNENPLHQFAFCGFSVNGTNIGGNCEIQTIGEVKFTGWGLIPNQQYLAGNDGQMTTINNSITGFTKVIGYAVDADTMLIVNYTTINK